MKFGGFSRRTEVLKPFRAYMVSTIGATFCGVSFFLSLFVPTFGQTRLKKISGQTTFETEISVKNYVKPHPPQFWEKSVKNFEIF